MAWDTAADILNDAAVELGLQSEDLTDPFDSTNAAIVQLRRALISVGRDLARQHPWRQLETILSINTTPSVVAYGLTEKFFALIEGGVWNTTTDVRLLGPASTREWDELQVRGGAGQAFRLADEGNIEIYPEPTAVENIRVSYRMKFWSDNDDEAAPNHEGPTEGEDVVWFDRRLMVCATKLRWLEWNGMPSDYALRDFESALAAALSVDGGKRISLTCRPWSLGQVSDPPSDGTWGT